MSFAMEVQADNSGTWAGNQLRFATEEEAGKYATDLMWRWTLVRDTRVVKSFDPVNYVWVDGKGALPIVAATVY